MWVDDGNAITRDIAPGFLLQAPFTGARFETVGRVSVGLPEVETLRLALPGSLSAIPEFVEVYDSKGRKMIKEVVSAAYQVGLARLVRG